MITQSELKQILHYCPETGVFTRLNHGRKVGKKLHNGYNRIVVLRKEYKAHRLAWLYVYGEFPKMHIDHINRIRNDNRIVNLREADYFLNRFNRGVEKISSKNKSGITGVIFNKKQNKWRAYIYKNYVNIYLGLFETKEEAGQARKDAELNFLN
jgi:hypothetical protein